MLFENSNYNDFDMFMNLSNIGNSYTSYQNGDGLSEGFLRGNMFDNEFKPYKGMKYIMPKLNSEREKLLAKIMCSSFAITDYSLYLDVNPNDETIFAKYNNEISKLENLKKEYENKFGPLCVTTGGYNSYKWISSPWPWEKDGAYYV